MRIKPQVAGGIFAKEMYCIVLPLLGQIWRYSDHDLWLFSSFFDLIISTDVVTWFRLIEYKWSTWAIIFLWWKYFWCENILKPNLQLRHQFLGHLRVGGVRLSCPPRPIMPCRVVSSRPGGVPGGPPECRRGVAPHVHHVGSLDLHHALLQPFHFSLHCPGKSRVLKFIFLLSLSRFFPLTADPRSDWSWTSKLDFVWFTELTPVYLCLGSVFTNRGYHWED